MTVDDTTPLIGIRETPSTENASCHSSHLSAYGEHASLPTGGRFGSRVNITQITEVKYRKEMQAEQDRHSFIIGSNRVSRSVPNLNSIPSSPVLKQMLRTENSVAHDSKSEDETTGNSSSLHICTLLTGACLHLKNENIRRARVIFSLLFSCFFLALFGSVSIALLVSKSYFIPDTTKISFIQVINSTTVDERALSRSVQKNITNVTAKAFDDLVMIKTRYNTAQHEINLYVVSDCEENWSKLDETLVLPMVKRVYLAGNFTEFALYEVLKMFISAEDLSFGTISVSGYKPANHLKGTRTIQTCPNLQMIEVLTVFDDMDCKQTLNLLIYYIHISGVKWFKYSGVLTEYCLVTLPSVLEKFQHTLKYVQLDVYEEENTYFDLTWTNGQMKYVEELSLSIKLFSLDTLPLIDRQFCQTFPSLRSLKITNCNITYDQTVILLKHMNLKRLTLSVRVDDELIDLSWLQEISGTIFENVSIRYYVNKCTELTKRLTKETFKLAEYGVVCQICGDDIIKNFCNYNKGS